MPEEAANKTFYCFLSLWKKVQEKPLKIKNQ